MADRHCRKTSRCCWSENRSCECACAGCHFERLPHLKQPLFEAWLRWTPEERGTFMRALIDRFLGPERKVERPGDVQKAMLALERCSHEVERAPRGTFDKPTIEEGRRNRALVEYVKRLEALVRAGDKTDG